MAGLATDSTAAGTGEETGLVAASELENAAAAAEILLMGTCL